jgi:hypothetical protein
LDYGYEDGLVLLPALEFRFSSQLFSPSFWVKFKACNEFQDFQLGLNECQTKKSLMMLLGLEIVTGTQVLTSK